MTDDDPIPRAVLRALPPHQAPAMTTTMASWTGFSLATVTGALICLRDAGLVHRSRARRNGWEWRRAEHLIP